MLWATKGESHFFDGIRISALELSNSIGLGAKCFVTLPAQAIERMAIRNASLLCFISKAAAFFGCGAAFAGCKGVSGFWPAMRILVGAASWGNPMASQPRLNGV